MFLETVEIFYFINYFFLSKVNICIENNHLKINLVFYVLFMTSEFEIKIELGFVSILN